MLFKYKLEQRGYMEANSKEELKQELELLGCGYDYEPIIEVLEIKKSNE